MCILTTTTEAAVVKWWLAAMTWANVDFQWRKLTIADKVESTRTIPLSPYMAHLLAVLPRLGPYVFASTGKAGRITDTRNSHAKALQSAAIEGLTILTGCAAPSRCWERRQGRPLELSRR